MSLSTSRHLASLRALFERLGQRWQGSLAQRGWHLWVAELRACLPERLRHLLIRDTPERLHLWPLSGPIESAKTGEQQVLLLPASAVMSHRLQLPLAAARDLSSVVGYELDRFMPFPREQLYFVARQDSRGASFIQVTLVAILRERLDRIIAECSAQGLSPHIIDVQTADGQRLGIDLLPQPLRPRQTDSGGRRLRTLVLLCAGLLVTAMLLWLNDRQQLVEEMQASVKAQRTQAAEIQALRQQLTNTRGAANYLAQRKASQPTMAALLSELTACVPTDTWIDQLEVDGNADVSFSGQSNRASALIARIKDCHSLENAQFQGVIQPDHDTGKDHFALRAHLHQEAANAPTPDTP
jgi:general secretion pathway protein L